MNCPKFGYENHPTQPECSRCGVIFAKIRPGRAQQQPILVESAGDERNKTNPLTNRLFLDKGDVSPSQLWGWLLALIIMVLWGSKLIFSSIASNSAGESFLHLINLPFHEAGHLLFSPFGDFITSLGGTLGQLVIPLICLGTLLLKTRDPFGATVCLWWFGENFLDIAPYIDDARAGELPLIGGNFGNSSPYGFHDWEYLLTETSLLRYDHLLAKISHLLGSFFILLAILWLGYLLYRYKKLRRQVRSNEAIS